MLVLVYWKDMHDLKVYYKLQFKCFFRNENRNLIAMSFTCSYSEWTCHLVPVNNQTIFEKKPEKLELLLCTGKIINIVRPMNKSSDISKIL